MKSNNLMGRVFRTLLVCALVSAFAGVAHANNIRIIGKPIITNPDTIKNTVLIKFDIAQTTAGNLQALEPRCGLDFCKVLGRRSLESRLPRKRR